MLRRYCRSHRSFADWCHWSILEFFPIFIGFDHPFFELPWFFLLQSWLRLFLQTVSFGECLTAFSLNMFVSSSSCGSCSIRNTKSTNCTDNSFLNQSEVSRHLLFSSLLQVSACFRTEGRQQIRSKLPFWSN